MLPGMNHNIMHNGKMYHIQTEDGGRKHPYVVSHLFLDGVILATERISYEEHLHLPDDELRPIVAKLMAHSHRLMINTLITGGYDHLSSGVADQPQTKQQPAAQRSQEPSAERQEQEEQLTDHSKEVNEMAKEAESQLHLKKYTTAEPSTTDLQKRSVSSDDPLNLYMIFGAPQEKVLLEERVSFRKRIIDLLGLGG